MTDLIDHAAKQFRLHPSHLSESRVREIDGEIQVYFPKARTWQNSAGKVCSEKPERPDPILSEEQRHGQFAESRASLRKAMEKAG